MSVSLPQRVDYSDRAQMPHCQEITKTFKAIKAQEQSVRETGTPEQIEALSKANAAYRKLIENFGRSGVDSKNLELNSLVELRHAWSMIDRSHADSDAWLQRSIR